MLGKYYHPRGLTSVPAKAEWTKDQESALLDILLYLKRRGEIEIRKNTKITSWDSITYDFNTKCGVEYTKQQLQNKMTEFKKRYFEIMSNSGHLRISSLDNRISELFQDMGPAIDRKGKITLPLSIPD